MKRERFGLIIILVLICSFTVGCHRHQYADATCTEPMKCTICGATKGEAKGHVWVDATCTTPKTCSVCGKTDGTELGHTTDFGICSTCGEKVGEDILSEMDDAFYDIMADLECANIELAILTEYNMFRQFQNAADEYAKSSTKYDAIIRLCDKSDELSTLKKLAQDAKKSIPKAPQSETQAEAKRFRDELDNYIKEFESFSDEYIRVASLIEE